MMNGLMHGNSSDKEDSSVTVAMQRITLMGSRLVRNKHTMMAFVLPPPPLSVGGKRF